jgi:hypothetical protein
VRTVALCSSSESGIAAGPLVTRPRKVSASVGISPCTDYLIVLHTPASGIDRAAERPLRLGEIQLTCRDDGINPLAGGLFGLGRIFGVVCGPGAVPRLQSHHAPAREKDEEAPPSKAQCQSSASLRCSQETQDSKALAGAIRVLNQNGPRLVLTRGDGNLQSRDSAATGVRLRTVCPHSARWRFARLGTRVDPWLDGFASDQCRGEVINRAGRSSSAVKLFRRTKEGRHNSEA